MSAQEELPCDITAEARQQEVRGQHAVEIAHLREAHRINIADKDEQIQALRLELERINVINSAVYIIGNRLVAYSQFSVALYAANKWTKPVVDQWGGLLEWLYSNPGFDLHGEGEEAHFMKISLRAHRNPFPSCSYGRKMYSRTWAPFSYWEACWPDRFGAGPSETAPPVCQGSEAAGSSSSGTSRAALKMIIGSAAVRRDGTTGVTRKNLNKIVHACDADPHRFEHNEFVDEEGRCLNDFMRAELRKGKPAPQQSPSAGSSSTLEEAEDGAEDVPGGVAEVGAQVGAEDGAGEEAEPEGKAEDGPGDRAEDRAWELSRGPNRGRGGARTGPRGRGPGWSHGWSSS